MLPFIKMHGLGNDFVVIDGRNAEIGLDPDRVRAIADRRRGVGCDQIVLIEPPRNGRAIARLRFFNADGGEAGACGNGTRCAAERLMAEANTRSVAIETAGGLLSAETAAGGLISVDMGPARTDWREIPLATEMDTLHLPLSVEGLADPVAVSMGNPHCVFFVADADAVSLERIGPAVEADPLFPERTNVEVASEAGPDTFRLRVWERGAGIPQACGTGGALPAGGSTSIWTGARWRWNGWRTAMSG